LLCLLFITHLLQNDTVTISSDDIPPLYRNYSGRWLHHQDCWYLVTADTSAKEVMVWRWPDGEGISLWGRSSPRERMIAPSASTIDAELGQLAIRCITSGRVFTLDLADQAPEFVRTYHADDLAGDMVIHGGALFGGAESLVLKQYHGNPLARLEMINQRLPPPQETSHPSQTAVSTHRMILAQVQAQGDLAVGYALHPFVYVISNEGRRTRIPIRFRGYEPPPEGYIDPFSFEANDAFFDRFHRLDGLSWHRGRLYGFMRRGFGGNGIWIDLVDPQRLTYINADHPTEMVIGVAVNQVILAEKTETEEEVVWHLSRSATIPKP